MEEVLGICGCGCSLLYAATAAGGVGARLLGCCLLNKLVSHVVLAEVGSL